ncbi:hypothetical protein K438DRAFT_1753350 [Mycena galopus ATCC 62051]|nr:hypothetical protein K438DRAFT_1753350 [Mycena galopus ATCC 62051]
MHPALSIENISQLPGRYKVRLSAFPPVLLLKLTHQNVKVMARSAANGSLRDLTRLYSYLDNLGEANCQLLLPIFYSALDPAGISPAASLDQPTSSSNDTDCCGRAAMSLNCVAQLTQIVNVFSPDLAAEFWPRIWAWIQFLYTHRDAVPVVVAADPVTTYSTYGHIIAHFVPDPMDATPELRVVITAVWKVLLGVRGDFQEATYVLLSCLIRPLGMDYSIEEPRFQGKPPGNPTQKNNVIWKPRFSGVPRRRVSGKTVGSVDGRDPKRSAVMEFTFILFIFSPYPTVISSHCVRNLTYHGAVKTNSQVL